jgi:hypothetical protein
MKTIKPIYKSWRVLELEECLPLPISNSAGLVVGIGFKIYIFLINKTDGRIFRKE